MSRRTLRPATPAGSFTKRRDAEEAAKDLASPRVAFNVIALPNGGFGLVRRNDR